MWYVLLIRLNFLVRNDLNLKIHCQAILETLGGTACQDGFLNVVSYCRATDETKKILIVDFIKGSWQ